MRARDENKEQAIRDNALEMVVDKGFDGLSMQKLAKKAGVSPATIYIYFKDREDLILQIYLRESVRLFDATLKNFDPGMSFEEGLRIQWINRAKYCIKYPKQMHFLEQIRHSPLYQKALALTDPRLQRSMETFVTNAIKRKQLVKVPVEVYWSIAFAPLYTLVNFHRVGTSVGGHKFVLTDKIMMETLRLVVKSLTP